MTIQTATELLNFLKACTFSPNWHPSLYVDGCNKLSSSHIDILLSLLNCQGCCSEDSMSDSCPPSQEDRKIGHIHEPCYDLLHNILTNHPLSDSLEDCLVEKILTVENGAFSDNDRTLTLLTHTLSCRVVSSGSQLRTRFYRRYAAFVVEKVKTTCIKCPCFKDLVGTLPSPFHIEVVLMAFHLSAEAEKAVMANLIFSTREEVANLALDLNNTVDMLGFSSFEIDLSSSSYDTSATNLSNFIAFRWAVKVEKSTTFRVIFAKSGFSASLGRGDLTIDSLTMNWKDIYLTFSLLLGLWRDKKATAMEDLILERYFFILYCHSLLGHQDDVGKFTTFPNVVLGLLQRLNAVLIPEGIEELGWDFLRNGIWLTLMVSFTNISIWNAPRTVFRRGISALLLPG